MIPPRPFAATASVAGLCLMFAGICHADVTPTLPPPARKEGVTFEQDIQPLFARSCTKCHGEEKQKAKLQLDTRSHALRGGKDGKVIVPGQSADSLLVKAISKATKHDDDWMPPAGKAQELTPEEIGLVRAWIDQGAN